EGFKNHVKKYDINDVEEYTGISKGRVLELAKIIHEGKRVSFWWTMGVNQGYQAVRTAQAVINLALMTGNIGRPGTGANSITGQCNAMGSRLFSNTTGLYGGGEYTDKARRKVVAKALGIDEEMLPKKPTIPYNAIIEGINNGTIKALWVLATNPVVSWINSLEFKKAAEKLEFLAVQDIYSDTETCKYAHLILPSTNGLKKEGVLINTERRLSKIQPVLEKKKDELSDYDILLGIGNALGMGSLLDKWKTPRDAFETLKECTRNMPCDITGVSYDMLKDSKGIQWPFKEGDDIEKEERRLFEDGKFYTPNKKAKFIYEDIINPPFEQSEEYPYILNTGRGTVGQWHTQTRTREIPDVEAIIMKKGYININTDLAEELGIKENDMVKVSSPNGISNQFLVKLSRTVKKDQLYAPMHYIEANSVLPSIFDTYSKEPNYKYGPVKIEKIN
ncbi:molybdopterin oxidoreductase family protein, partial [Clostridium tertium]|uniref:molybdopterin oxidoreductase family protein n=2 Tax=Clostridiaceae TaxID=31979 RepID=UPI002420397B